ncbi:hypothetical protein CALCODRAFT_254697 [Calocera cornea HHB12733]|uniref:TPR-like protein n=1 Tax=Calocera cornea HHB12733 TaxID=1353952 RepID=A0A165GMQ1_9BASI|nr:hypothetical protein CALCODRAFT_254697 [Calocera cornea HHB12733]
MNIKESLKLEFPDKTDALAYYLTTKPLVLLSTVAFDKGAHEEGLSIIDRALSLTRESTRPELILKPKLARNLLLRSRHLLALNRPKDALSDVLEGLELLRPAANRYPAAWNPLLKQILVHKTDVHRAMGQLEEANSSTKAAENVQLVFERPGGPFDFDPNRPHPETKGINA